MNFHRFMENQDGISVKASGEDSTGRIGYAGGYAGLINGGHIQNSHVENFEYIIGQETAGGYVGELQPGRWWRLS